jgi:hypothetical protein
MGHQIIPEVPEKIIQVPQVVLIQLLLIIHIQHPQTNPIQHLQTGLIRHPHQIIVQRHLILAVTEVMVVVDHIEVQVTVA